MSKRSREQCAEDGNETEEDEDLKQAIALSLQQRTPPAKKSKVEPIIVVDDDDTEEDEDLKRAILESLKYSSSSTTTKKSPQKEKIGSQKDTQPNTEKQSINSNPNSANNSSPFKLNFIEGMEAT